MVDINRQPEESCESCCCDCDCIDIEGVTWNMTYQAEVDGVTHTFITRGVKIPPPEVQPQLEGD